MGVGFESENRVVVRVVGIVVVVVTVVVVSDMIGGTEREYLNLVLK